MQNPSSLLYRRLPSLTALLWILLLGAWLGHVLGMRTTAGAGLWLLRGLALAALLSLVWILLRLALHSRRWLVILVLVAAVVRLAGIEHEVEERYYLDEGTYYHHATEINQGKALRYSFVYPHFLYYADAFLLWLVALFPGLWAGVAGLVGVRQAIGVEWLALRVAAALFSASAVVPVSGLALRLGRRWHPRTGEGAGLVAAVLIAFSPLFNGGSHVNLSDGPSAVLAAFCLYYVARLVERERLRDYLWAGVFSGLAAATKYPAGVVAVAIVVVWLKGCWERRRPTSYLLWAGLASLITFVAVMPSLLVAPGQAFFGGRGIFFGLHQYSGGGWIGVMPTNNAVYYGGLIVENFGPAAAFLGGAGLLVMLSRRPSRASLLWNLPFPLLYLGLIIAMNMVVERNLYPALPPLAALLGTGVVVLGTVLLERFSPIDRTRRRAAVAFLALVVAWPVLTTLVQAVSFTRPSTRQLAARWIEASLPTGSGIVKEAYTPHLPRDRFAQYQRRFVPRIPPEEIHDDRWEYLLLAGNAYGRFFNEKARTKAHHEVFAERYRTMLAYPAVRDFEPGLLTRGPLLRLLRIPESGAERSKAVFRPGDAYVPDGSMVPPVPGRAIRYTRPGQWALFKARLVSGTYRLEAGVGRPGEEGQGWIQITALDSLEPDKPGEARELRRLSLEGEALEVHLPEADKILFYVHLPQGARLRGLAVLPQSSGDGSGGAESHGEG